jgi:hypothetical protein
VTRLFVCADCERGALFLVSFLQSLVLHTGAHRLKLATLLLRRVRAWLVMRPLLDTTELTRAEVSADCDGFICKDECSCWNYQLLLSTTLLSRKTKAPKRTDEGAHTTHLTRETHTREKNQVLKMFRSLISSTSRNLCNRLVTKRSLHNFEKLPYAPVSLEPYFKQSTTEQHWNIYKKYSDLYNDYVDGTLCVASNSLTVWSQKALKCSSIRNCRW